MNSWERDFEEEEDIDEGCNYGVSEPCAEPQTRAMGLCTTECSAYFDAVEAEEKEGVDKTK